MITIKDLKEFIEQNHLSDDTPITIDTIDNTTSVDAFGVDEGFGWEELVLIGNED